MKIDKYPKVMVIDRFTRFKAKISKICIIIALDNAMVLN